MIFQPVGEKSRRALVLEALRDAEVGEVVSYEKLSEKLRTTDRSLIQAAVNAAKKEFGKVDLRAVKAVPNEGYRIVAAREHMDLAKVHQSKARKQLVKSKDLVVRVDYNALTPAEQKMAQAMGYMLAQQADFMRRYDIRHKNLERALEAITVEVTETKEGQDDIKARLAAVEAKLGVRPE